MGYNKKTKKLPLSASHLMLYIVLGAYLSVVVFGIVMVWNLLGHEYIDFAVQVLIGLFSFVGVCGSVSISFYSWKAKAENEAASTNRKYEERLKMAKQICDDLKERTVDKQSVLLLRALIIDTDHSCCQGHSINTVPEPEQPDFSVDDILNDMDMEGKG